MDNYYHRVEPKKKSLVSKLAIFSTAALLVGVGVHNYQNDKNTEVSQSQQEAVQFVGVDYSPEDTQFDKLVSQQIEYSNKEKDVASKKEFDEATEFFAKDETQLMNSENPMSSLARFAVGSAGGPHRCLINHPDKDQTYWNNPKNSMSYRGWSHQMAFLAFSDQVPGSKRIALGQAWNPHRSMLNHPSYSQSYWNNQHQQMSVSGWSGYGDFWAYDSPKAGTIRVAVGQAWNPHRMMVNHPDKSQDYWNNRGHSMSYRGWSHFYEFWAYPDDLQIEKLTYKLDKAQMLSQKPIHAFSTELINHSSVKQTNTIEFSYTKSEEYSWSHSLEVGLTVTAGGSAGVPLVANGHWEVSVSTTYNYQTSNTVSKSETRTYSSPVSVAPKTKITAECTTQEAKMEVPYEITFSSKYGKPVVGLQGVWNGVSVSHVKCEYRDSPL